MQAFFSRNIVKNAIRCAASPSEEARRRGPAAGVCRGEALVVERRSEFYASDWRKAQSSKKSSKRKVPKPCLVGFGVKPAIENSKWTFLLGSER
jgi:hypothetical protein